MNTLIKFCSEANFSGLRFFNEPDISDSVQILLLSEYNNGWENQVVSKLEIMILVGETGFSCKRYGYNSSNIIETMHGR